MILKTSSKCQSKYFLTEMISNYHNHSGNVAIFRVLNKYITHKASCVFDLKCLSARNRMSATKKNLWTISVGNTCISAFEMLTEAFLHASSLCTADIITMATEQTIIPRANGIYRLGKTFHNSR